MSEIKSDREICHELLDKIMDSGQASAIYIENEIGIPHVRLAKVKTYYMRVEITKDVTTTEV